MAATWYQVHVKSFGKWENIGACNTIEEAKLKIDKHFAKHGDFRIVKMQVVKEVTK